MANAVRQARSHIVHSLSVSENKSFGMRIVQQSCSIKNVTAVLVGNVALKERNCWAFFSGKKVYGIYTIECKMFTFK